MVVVTVVVIVVVVVVVVVGVPTSSPLTADNHRQQRTTKSICNIMMANANIQNQSQ